MRFSGYYGNLTLEGRRELGIVNTALMWERVSEERAEAVRRTLARDNQDQYFGGFHGSDEISVVVNCMKNMAALNSQVQKAPMAYRVGHNILTAIKPSMGRDLLEDSDYAQISLTSYARSLDWQLREREPDRPPLELLTHAVSLTDRQPIGESRAELFR